MSGRENVGGIWRVGILPSPKVFPSRCGSAVPSGQGGGEAAGLEEREVGSAELAPGCKSGGGRDVGFAAEGELWLGICLVSVSLPRPEVPERDNNTEDTLQIVR